MGQSSTTQRIHSLDGLRGVACLAVLLLHVAMMLELWGPDGAYPLIPGTPAVVIFFVLSGVVLSIMPLARLRARGTYDWLGYYPRRVVRLGVPLVAAVALGIAAGYVAWRMGSTGRSATAVEFAGTPQQVVHDVLMQFDVLFFVSDDTQNLFGDPLVRVNSPVWSMSWELVLPHAAACGGVSCEDSQGRYRSGRHSRGHLRLALVRVLSAAAVPHLLAWSASCQASLRAIGTTATRLPRDCCSGGTSGCC